MVRHRMVRLGHADLRIGARAALARELERDDARHVRLQRQHLQIEHQLDVLFPVGGHARRALERRQRRFGRLLLGALNAPLDLAHRVEVAVHPRAIAGAERATAAAPCRPSPSRECWRCCAAPRGARPACRRRRTAARTRAADRLRSAAAWSATTTTGCSDTRRRSRCRSCRPARSGRCRARATESACRRRPAARRSDRS